MRGLTDGLTIEWSDDRIHDISNGQTHVRAIEQTIGLSLERPKEQPSDQTDEQSDGHVREQSAERTNGRPEGQSTRSKRALLTENQGRVLEYLFEVAEGLTNVNEISSETQIAYGTVRKSLEVLLKEGYMLSKKRYNGHAFNGFEYSMCNPLCLLYLAQVRGGQSVEQSKWRAIGQSVERSNGQSVGRTMATSSSNFINKPTTTQNETGILNDPELRYWVDEGVTEKQIQRWMEEFHMNSDEMAMSLRFARFDILGRGDVRNAANWFYKILERNCFYPRPPGYRSAAELRLEAMEQEIAKEKEARLRLVEAETEKEFLQILADSDGKIYQELLGKVSSFAREEGGDILEIAMRDEYARSRIDRSCN